MKIFISLFIGIICAMSAYSQTGAVSGNSSGRTQIISSDKARYQIISFGQIYLTVKLDRYTGKTFQYYNERKRWYPLEVRGGLPASPATDQTPKYQISDEGEFVFLINTETGQSWIFNQRTWEPVTD